MSLMQVLTRDSLQSTTTPYAFLGSSSFIHQEAGARDNSDSIYFQSIRDSQQQQQQQRTCLPSSDASTTRNNVEEIQHFSAKDSNNLRLSTTSISNHNDNSSHGSSRIKDSTTMNTNLQQQHVAQQSRREKLRISSGSLQHPASPQSGGGSVLGLEMRHQGASPDLQHETMEGGANLRGYPGTQSHDMMSVYTPMLASDLYNYTTTTGTEFLNTAGAGKNQQGYLCVSGDGIPPAPGLIGSIYNSPAHGGAGGGGYSGQQVLQSKGGSYGQFGPASLSSSAGGSAIPATVLVGSAGLQQGGLGPYLSNPSNAQDAMQLYLMNAGYSSFGDGGGGGGPGNMVFQVAGGGSSGIPVQGSQNNSLSQNSQVTSVSNSPVGYTTGRAAGTGPFANAWRNGDELLFMPASERAKSFPGNTTASQQEGNSGVGAEFGDYGLREPSLGVGSQQALHVENAQASVGGYQSLSLSLSSQQPQTLHAYDVLNQPALDSPAATLSQENKRQLGGSGSKLGAAGDLSHFRREYAAASGKLDTGTSAATMSASFNIITNSRYLKACQQLLEEVCSVGRGLKQPKSGKNASGAATGGARGPSPSPALASPTSKDGNAGAQENSSVAKEATAAATAAAAGNTPGAASTATGGSPSPSSRTAAAAAPAAVPATSNSEPGESATKLTAEERQEFETKKSKLVAMLQEVDRRYRQYNDQMQVVINSFDAVAGTGAATPYTALALQAMSRYFRCLKDAITGQIQQVCKTLGEEDISKQLTTKSPTSRLRFIDQQLRQQRAFQQLGMLNQHAWRPQRGLPERSVSILRAWLFEHFLHPYPKDADKMMLARQTGLTRSQVSNWFINARVRLWKPMVEEMYQDETRDHELDAAVSRMHAENEEAAASAAAASGGSYVEPQSSSLDNTKSKDDFVVDNSAGGDYMLRKQSLLYEQQQQQQPMQQQQQQSRQTLKRPRYTIEEDNILHQQQQSSGLEVELKPDLSSTEPSQHHQSISTLLQAQQSQQSFGYAFPGSGYNPTSGGVSLTLGLQHSDNLSLSAGAFLQQQQQQHQQPQGFQPASLYDSAATALSGGHDGYSSTTSSRKHIESQLLHDFVA